jgi:hypothetical protein
MWTGKMMGVRAVHVWHFEPRGDTTIARTEESWDGLAARLLRRPFRKLLQSTLDRGVERLKEVAEGDATIDSPSNGSFRRPGGYQPSSSQLPATVAVARRMPRTHRWAAAAGFAYVAAWLIGLLAAPSGPSLTASPQSIQAYFATNHSAFLTQSILVHGVAGAALIALAVLLAVSFRERARASARLNKAVMGAGLAAGAVSFVQVGFAVALNLHLASGGRVTTTSALFDAINKADSIKLACLALVVYLVTSLTARAGALPRSIRGLGYALIPILPLGGLAFIVDNMVLNIVLTLSLPILLLWTAAVSIVSLRFRPRNTDAM